MTMTTRVKSFIAATMAAVALAAFAAVAVASPQTPPAAPTHEDMHQMMDAMHGEGASARMHEAMGEEAERLMDQCTSMMGMMSNMGGMGGGMMGTPGK